MLAGRAEAGGVRGVRMARRYWACRTARWCGSGYLSFGRSLSPWEQIGTSGAADQQLGGGHPHAGRTPPRRPRTYWIDDERLALGSSIEHEGRSRICQDGAAFQVLKRSDKPDPARHRRSTASCTDSLTQGRMPFGKVAVAPPTERGTP